MRGTSHEQDSRFTDKRKQMMNNSVWPDKYDIKIDLQKVDIELIKTWVDRRVTKLLGQQDDIVSGTVNSLLEDYMSKEQKPDAKKMHIDLSGFLKDKTLTLMSELWDILDDAQKSKNGIPECLIKQKREQQKQQRDKLEQIRRANTKYNNRKFDNLIKRNQLYDGRRESSKYQDVTRRQAYSRYDQNRKNDNRQRDSNNSNNNNRLRERSRDRSREKDVQRQKLSKHKRRRSSESQQGQKSRKVNQRKDHKRKHKNDSKKRKKDKKRKRKYSASSSSYSSSQESSSNQQLSKIVNQKKVTNQNILPLTKIPKHVNTTPIHLSSSSDSDNSSISSDSSQVISSDNSSSSEQI